MKTKEAKQIVKQIINWQHCNLGVLDRREIQDELDLKTYSLEELIKANKLVRLSNKRKKSLAKYNRKKTGKSSPYSVSMTLDDRVIAGVYVALHYPPNSKISVLMNDVGVGCMTVSYS